MDAFLNFFEVMPAWQKLAWVIACLGFCWLLEGAYPLVRFSYLKWNHAKVNLIFLSITMVINILFGILAAGIFLWVQSNNIGLLFLFDLPVWVELLIAVLLLDLIAQYFVHFLLHRIKWMWKLHMIHHSDISVDATTGTRHHPGDFLLRETFALGAIILIGAPISYYFFYRICTIFFTYITHANVKCPGWVDYSFGLIFITPNMHKFHHHFERPWTDTNFGNIFSFWDRIFDTMVIDDPSKINYGLDVLEDNTSQDLGYQLRIPFNTKIKTDY